MKEMEAALIGTVADISVLAWPTNWATSIFWMNKTWAQTITTNGVRKLKYHI
jgi:hypothetical protein